VRGFGYEVRMRARGAGARPILGGVATIVIGVSLLLAPRLKAARGAFAVATENATATREAVQILRLGGSAFDAAVTAALVAGVTSPSSSGLGGGGFALSYDAQGRRLNALDFREMAPKGLDPAHFEERPLPDEARGALVGVPGELAGLVELHKRGGRLPFSQLVARAESRAKDGFFVSPHLAMVLDTARDKIQKSSHLKAIYYPGDKPAFVGKRVTNPELARTLAELRVDGPSAFYDGPIADALVALARDHGSSLTRDDFRAYQVIEREPLCANFEGRRVCTMPPPSAGGLLLLQTLALFSADELRSLGHGSAAYQHLLAEGMRGALADRLSFIGDPEFEKVDLVKLLSSEHLGPRRTRIALDRTHALPRFVQSESGTHHLVVRDREGNVVSLTTTINRAFGAALADDVTGIVLNDQLDDFTAQNSMQKLGFLKVPNRARPGARPVSSMTPVLTFLGDEVEMAAGGSGGLMIAPNVTQVLLEALVFGHIPSTAVSSPRFFVPFEGKTMLLEGQPTESHLQSLSFRGEIVGAIPKTSTAVQMIVVRDGNVRAASDPRKYGEAVSE
jgi:gamma-glutamyltranspeptidase / glutathione hydrolase